MKPTLQLKLSQQLKLTPQLQQSIRLLQLSTLELNQEIERALQENPLLEEESGLEYSESTQQTGESTDQQVESSEGAAADNNSEADNKAEVEMDVDTQDNDFDHFSNQAMMQSSRESSDYETQQIEAHPLSLREHLNLQISLSQISERDRRIVSLLIDSLDDDGYLKQDLTELLEIIPSELEIGIEDLNIALVHLQYLDPPGVGARDLRECLLLQLKMMPDDTAELKQAMKLVNEHLDTLASRDFTRIKKLLGCDDDRLQSIQQLITQLNPRPGSAFGSTEARYVVPDVVVSKVEGEWVANLNMESVPRLSINHLYANILKQKRDDSSKELAGQLNEAKWLIKNIQQRSQTILRVSSVIVERQRQFFEHGPVAMRPMVLREIAAELDLHESTISRVTTQKFMRTPRGIFELKYFFGSQVATDSGGTCSATAIRELIKRLVQDENPRKPLSDNRISGELEQQGIVVARRTIAKYRESMHIPPANLRKSF